MKRTGLACVAAGVMLGACGNTHATAGATRPAAARASSAPSTPTRVLYVAPIDANGDLAEGFSVARTTHGECHPGSDAVPGPTYRCFTGNFIEDPCWADSAVPGSVLCLTQPWAKSVTRVDVNELEPNNEPVPKSLSYPWGVELTTGEKCLAFQGAHDQYRGRVVDYGCNSAYLHGGRVLLRGMHRAKPQWSFDSAWWTGRKYQPRHRVTVRVAWYGGPSPS